MDETDPIEGVDEVQDSARPANDASWAERDPEADNLPAPDDEEDD